MSFETIWNGLILLAATAVAIFLTLLFRGYLLEHFSGISFAGLFPPYLLGEAGFVFLISAVLFASLAVRMRSRGGLWLGSALVLYFLGVFANEKTVMVQPATAWDDVITLLPLNLPKLALLLAFFAVMGVCKYKSARRQSEA